MKIPNFYYFLNKRNFHTRIWISNIWDSIIHAVSIDQVNNILVKVQRKDWILSWAPHFKRDRQIGEGSEGKNKNDQVWKISPVRKGEENQAGSA